VGLCHSWQTTSETIFLEQMIGKITVSSLVQAEKPLVFCDQQCLHDHQTLNRTLGTEYSRRRRIGFETGEVAGSLYHVIKEAA